MNPATVSNANVETLLHIADGYDRVNLASYLVSKSAYVDVKDKDGQALSQYPYCRDYSIKLVEAGAHVNLTENQAWSSMHSALIMIQNIKLHILEIYLVYFQI